MKSPGPISSGAWLAWFSSLAWVATTAWSLPAAANGALPATIQALLPPAAPTTIIVTTTFGLVISDDDGGSWRWICEHDGGLGGGSYQFAAGQPERILTLGTNGLALTRDRGCQWSPLLDQSAAMFFDYFPDPVQGDRILLLGTLLDGIFPSAIVEAKLGAAASGTTSTRVLWKAAAGELLRTVEMARSDPRVVYASMYTPNSSTPARLARSSDGGTSWTVVIPQPATPAPFGIIAVDPADPQKLFFRVVADDGDKLAISQDGGQTMRVVLGAGRVLSSFLRLGNGHLLVGWLDLDQGLLYRSTDAGVTFVPVPGTIHPNGLAAGSAAHPGRIYAVLDSVADKHALAMSDDEGSSWTYVMAFDQVTTLAACANASVICASSCQDLVTRRTFTAALCRSESFTYDAAPDSENDAMPATPPEPDAASAPGQPAVASDGGGGCSCTAAGDEDRPDSAQPLLFSALSMIVAATRRRGRSAARFV